MCVGFDLGDEAEADVRTFAETLCGLLDQSEFQDRIDLYRIDPGIDRFFEFPDLFARSVENDLVAAKSDLECLPKFTTRVDLDVAARIFYCLENAIVDIALAAKQTFIGQSMRSAARLRRSTLCRIRRSLNTKSGVPCALASSTAETPSI